MMYVQPALLANGVYRVGCKASAGRAGIQAAACRNMACGFTAACQIEVCFRG